MTRGARDFSSDPQRAGAIDAGGPKAVTRREALALIGVSGAGLALTGCGDAENPSLMTMTSPTPVGDATCSVTPTETAGPFPSINDFFRSDIREGKPGTSLMLTIQVVNVNASCAPVGNANVEVWQADAAGNYSEYGSQTGQTYLRGIQTTSSVGEVVFRTIYPGWYQGRATHIHVEVSLNAIVIKTTQIAFPESVTAQVYATGVYAPRGGNPTSNASDNVFSDSLASELVTPAGDPAGGYTAKFQIGVSI